MGDCAGLQAADNRMAHLDFPRSDVLSCKHGKPRTTQRDLPPSVSRHPASFFLAASWSWPGWLGASSGSSGVRQIQALGWRYPAFCATISWRYLSATVPSMSLRGCCAAGIRVRGALLEVHWLCCGGVI